MNPSGDCCTLPLRRRPGLEDGRGGLRRDAVAAQCPVSHQDAMEVLSPKGVEQIKEKTAHGTLL